MLKREAEVLTRQIERLDPVEAAATLIAGTVIGQARAVRVMKSGLFDEIEDELAPLAMKNARDCELKVKGLYAHWRRGRWIGWRSEKAFRELAELRARELYLWTSEGGPRPW